MFKVCVILSPVKTSGSDIYDYELSYPYFNFVVMTQTSFVNIKNQKNSDSGTISGQFQDIKKEITNIKL